jgi:hypothetical protein
MSLTITRISVSDAQTEQALKMALEQLGVPAGENWTLALTVSRAAGAWEMVLEGAPRLKAEHIAWEIVQHADRTRYRKLFQGRREQSVEHVKRCVRQLFWEAIHFQEENPIKAVSPQLAAAFEETVWSVLRHSDLKPLHVRFGLWREGFDGMKFVCKVEYPALPGTTPQLPWTWWSSLVRMPEDLGSELQRALTARQKRQAAARARLRAARRVVPAPMPQHPQVPASLAQAANA